ncbi:hypothetical protein AB1N83_009395 [Pleurotus pulmonarius]
MRDILGRDYLERPHRDAGTKSDPSLPNSNLRSQIASLLPSPTGISCRVGDEAPTKPCSSARQWVTSGHIAPYPFRSYATPWAVANPNPSHWPPSSVERSREDMIQTTARPCFGVNSKPKDGLRVIPGRYKAIVEQNACVHLIKQVPHSIGTQYAQLNGGWICTSSHASTVTVKAALSSCTSHGVFVGNCSIPSSGLLLSVRNTARPSLQPSLSVWYGFNGQGQPPAVTSDISRPLPLQCNRRMNPTP